MTTRTSSPTSARLVEHAQVVYLDLRGHGRSDWGYVGAWSFEACADDVRVFCDTVGIARPDCLRTLDGRHLSSCSTARATPDMRLVSSSSRDLHGGTTPRMVEGFSPRCWRNEVAELSRRSYSGEEVSDEQWARVFAAFGAHLPDDEREAHTPQQPSSSNARGMDLMCRLDVVEQLSQVASPTLVSVGALDPVTPVEAAEEIVVHRPKASRSSRSSTERATSPGWTHPNASGR